MPTKAPSLPFDRPLDVEQDARNALAALRRSGKPAATHFFAALSRGSILSACTSMQLRLWASAEPTRFQELIVRPSAWISVVDGDAPFEVALSSGVVVRVPASFNAAALKRLLEVLQARAC